MSLRKPSEPPKRLPSHIQHGTLTAYTYYECRCDECRQCAREYVAEWRARARRPSRVAPPPTQRGKES